MLQSWFRFLGIATLALCLSAAVSRADTLPLGPGLGLANPQPLIVAGASSGTPADSPSLRVDANTTTSPFAGVVSVEVHGTSGTYLGSGTFISSTQILTAGHMIDLNNNGTIAVAPGSVSVHVNYGTNNSQVLTASALHLNPAFQGFNNSIFGDLAIITLSAPAAAGVPIYSLYTQPMPQYSTLDLVGYGKSAYGTETSYTVGASFNVKRHGQNAADGLLSAAAGDPSGVFYFDFDSPTGTVPNYVGGTSLGNNLETQLGPGDSGGPAFLNLGGTYYQAGVDTFTTQFVYTDPFGNIVGIGENAPSFGSAGGGILLYPYLPWISQVTGLVLPEPASVSLLALGAMMLVFRPRR